MQMVLFLFLKSLSNYIRKVNNCGDFPVRATCPSCFLPTRNKTQDDKNQEKKQDMKHTFYWAFY